ncbi:uncharacterized protein TA15730 [Theileria annulata]|uniref:Uncharacterized protein n=1 Tax=Theileria annulata TaxID=5874 RepID=Q4UFN1_THEAN|nr:uncharacterized protein TA15730 [Theileria annulata]CAI74085.1 hypothetical protein, conserved [Theileria annulata]|eukprot:XP_951817.1 hypothetical protein, conserved [Theileria annulata]
MVLFACYARSNIPRDLVHYKKKELEKQYVRFIKSSSHETSRAFCESLVEKCSIRNLKTLVALGEYGIKNNKLSVMDKTNIVQMFVLISKVRDYNCLLLYKSDLLKILYKYAMVLKTCRPYCFRKDIPQLEIIRFSEYVVHVIDEFSNCNSYGTLPDDGIPVYIKKFSKEANKIKSKLMKKGVKFTMGSWDMPYHRNESLNTLGDTDELIMVKSLGERTQELQENISTIEAQMQSNNIFEPDSSVDESLISELIRTLSLYEFKTQNLIQESVDSESMENYDQLMNILDYIKHLINTLNSKMCISLDQEYIGNNLSPVSFDPFNNSTQEHNVNETSTEQINRDESDVSTELCDISRQDETESLHQQVETQSQLLNYRMTSEESSKNISKERLEDIFDPFGINLNNQSSISTHRTEHLSTSVLSTVDELIDANLNKSNSEDVQYSNKKSIQSYQRSKSLDEFAQKSMFSREKSQENRSQELDSDSNSDKTIENEESMEVQMNQFVDKKDKKLFKSKRSNSFKSTQRKSNEFDLNNLTDELVLDDTQVECLVNNIQIPEEIEIQEDERDCDDSTKTDDVENMNEDISYVMNTLKRINKYLESKPPKFVANSKTYQEIQASLHTDYFDKCHTFGSDNLSKTISEEQEKQFDQEEKTAREEIFGKELFSNLDENLYKRLSNIYLPKKNSNFPSNVPYDNTLVKPSISSPIPFPSYSTYSINTHITNGYHTPLTINSYIPTSYNPGQTNYYTINYGSTDLQKSSDLLDKKGICNDSKKAEIVFTKGIPSDNLKNKLIKQSQLAKRLLGGIEHLSFERQQISDFEDESIFSEEELDVKNSNRSTKLSPDNFSADEENNPEHFDDFENQQEPSKFEDNINEYGYPILDFNEVDNESTKSGENEKIPEGIYEKFSENKEESEEEVGDAEGEDDLEEDSKEGSLNYHKVFYNKYKSNEELSDFSFEEELKSSETSDKSSKSEDKKSRKKSHKGEKDRYESEKSHRKEKGEKRRGKDRKESENEEKSHKSKSKSGKKHDKIKKQPTNDNDFRYQHSLYTTSNLEGSQYDYGMPTNYRVHPAHYYNRHMVNRNHRRRSQYEDRYDPSYYEHVSATSPFDNHTSFTDEYDSYLSESSYVHKPDPRYYASNRNMYRRDDQFGKAETTSKIVELSSTSNTDYGSNKNMDNIGKYVKIVNDNEKFVKNFKIQENGGKKDKNEETETPKSTEEKEPEQKLDNSGAITNSNIVKRVIKRGGDIIYQDELFSVKFKQYTRYEPVLYNENTITIENNSLFSFSISLDYSNFENFPINLKFLNKEFKNLSLTPEAKITQYFSTYCFGPFVGLPKLEITAHVDASTDKKYNIYLPIAISCFFVPTLDINSLSQRYFNSDKFRHIMKNKVYFNIPKVLNLRDVLTIITTYGRFKILQQSDQYFYLASTFSAPFYFNSTELYKFTIFAMIEISPSYYNVHISSDSYRLANTTSMLFKYILQQ